MLRAGIIARTCAARSLLAVRIMPGRPVEAARRVFRSQAGSFIYCQNLRQTRQKRPFPCQQDYRERRRVRRYIIQQELAALYPPVSHELSLDTGIEAVQGRDGRHEIQTSSDIWPNSALLCLNCTPGWGEESRGRDGLHCCPAFAEAER